MGNSIDIIKNNFNIDSKLKLLEILVKNTTDAFLIINNKLEIVFLNNIFCELLAGNEYDFIGKNISKILIGNSVVNHIDLINTVFKTQKDSLKFHITIVNKKFKRLYLIIQYIYLDENFVLMLINDNTLITEKDEDFKRRRDDIEYLNNKALELLKIYDDDKFYDFVTDEIQKLFGDCIVLLNIFDGKVLRLINYKGISKEIEGFLGVLKINLKNMEISKVPVDILEKFTNKKLQCVNGGIFELTFGKINKITADMIEKILGIKKIYFLGISYLDEIFGSIIILKKDNFENFNTDMVENFSNMISITFYRKKLEKLIDYNRYFEKKIMDVSPTPIAIIKSNGEIEYISKTVERKFRIYVEYFIGKKVKDFFDVKNFKKIINQLKNIREGTYSIEEYEVNFVFDNRTIRKNVIIDIDTFFDKDNKVKYIATIGETNEQKTEEEKEIQKKKEKEIEIKNQYQFISKLSHQLRNPMNSIIGFIELLKNSQLSDSEKSTYIDIIYNSTKNLLKFLDNLIEFSDATSTLNDFLYKEIHLSKITDYIKNLHPDLEIKNYNITGDNVIYNNEEILINVINNIIIFLKKYALNNRVVIKFMKNFNNTEIEISLENFYLSREKIEKMLKPFCDDYDISEPINLQLAISYYLLKKIGIDLSININNNKITFSFPLDKK